MERKIVARKTVAAARKSFAEREREARESFALRERESFVKREARERERERERERGSI